MKVIQINSVCGKGSTGKIAVDIYNHLINKGDECLIAFGRGTAPENVNSFRFNTDFGVKLHGAVSRINDRQGFLSTAATKKLTEKIISYNPDIIHLHNIHGYYLNVKVLFEFLAKYNKPVVWTLHDCWAFTGHCAYFSYADCNRWIDGCYNCPLKKSYPASIFLDNSKLNYSQKKILFNSIKNLHIVTPSHWLKNTVENSFLKENSVTTIYNGIDLNVFKPTESNIKSKLGIENKKMYLGVANIWEKRKGLEDFIKLSYKLAEDEVIVLVGLDKSQIASLPKGIIGIERTESVNELLCLYTAADVYINTSVEETMGLTTLEALAAGTPAIVYNKTAVPEVVDESCGTVVEAGNIDSLYNAISNINFKSEDCIKRSEFFEKDKQYTKYYNLYKSIISKF